MDVELTMGIAIIVALAVVLLPAAVVDWRTRRIPNWLCLAGALLGIIMHAGFSGFDGVLASAGGFGLALLIGFLLFAVGWMGAGDAKLLAALGAIVGLSQTPEFLFWIVMSGGVVALVAMAARGVLQRILKRFWASLMLSLSLRRWTQVPLSDAEAVEIPYAVSIALGALVAVIVGKVWLV